MSEPNLRVSGAVIDFDVVKAVAAQKIIDREDAEGNPTGTTVTAEVLADTARQYPECRCNELGLEAGFPIKELITLEEGCTEQLQGQHWVCPRLNTIRSIYKPWVNHPAPYPAHLVPASVTEGDDEEDQ